MDQPPRIPRRARDQILDALKRGDVPAVAAATSRNFEGPIQDIIPWASNDFTEKVIGAMHSRYGDDYLGFCMLGGMSGGGMGFMFKPSARDAARDDLLEVMTATKRDLESGLPFAMDPVVYDFEINNVGTTVHGPSRRRSPPARRVLHPDRPQTPAPGTPGSSRRSRRAELDRFGSACRSRSELQWVVPALFDRLFPRSEGRAQGPETLDETTARQRGFDPVLHEEIRANLRDGRIGLSQNRLPGNTDIRGRH